VGRQHDDRLGRIGAFDDSDGISLGVGAALVHAHLQQAVGEGLRPEGKLGSFVVVISRGDRDGGNLADEDDVGDEQIAQGAQLGCKGRRIERVFLLSRHGTS
jgi:hypothetical protein